MRKTSCPECTLSFLYNQTGSSANQSSVGFAAPTCSVDAEYNIFPMRWLSYRLLPWTESAIYKETKQWSHKAMKRPWVKMVVHQIYKINMYYNILQIFNSTKSQCTAPPPLKNKTNIDRNQWSRIGHIANMKWLWNTGNIKITNSYQRRIYTERGSGGGRGAGWKLTQGAEVRGRFDITLFFLTKKTPKKTRKQCW